MRWELWSGSYITYRVPDDPDAVVKFTLRGKPSEHRDRELTDAVTVGRSRSTRLRLAIKTFAQYGHEVIAFSENEGTPWIAAPPTDDTLTGLSECVHHWSQALTEAGMTPDHDLSVILIDPETARRGPTPNREHPTWLRMTDHKVRTALLNAPRHTVTYTVHDGIVAPTSATPRLVQPLRRRR